ncbi:pentapeptide repeat-containing protein (plasmid) [Streptomyces sp. NBC_01795]|uniref:pentapeptide repeat-containing protein n=1 Tax=unclassified Streptomyces TaxID=2593676 RepID=UPI002DDAC979|nr:MULTISPECIES: pentapeptide repeat-containing protein [unclassified Streptomyces]WSA97578.1 pentapeptide repeat-containing protein [Streptomyces sp. NBC_01795]WSB82174.1 pentapeptide repeat-containing protein [Streptomyces sp. NBC_01775]WSS18145.1 pentapeptide repeat-containing protein [Streptomyces sp. NBC_01186]
MTASNGTVPTTPTPPWPHCGHEAEPDCRGIRVGSHDYCLAHLEEADRSAYLASLQPGADIDHRGTRFDGVLLAKLLSALTPTADDRAHLGSALFMDAEFEGDVRFTRAVFNGEARFTEARFRGDVEFVGATFKGKTDFSRSEFSNHVNFFHVEVDGDISFALARIGGNGIFTKVDISGSASFHMMEFGGLASFADARIKGDTKFHRTNFQRAPKLGPMSCCGTLDLSEATFGAAVTIEVAAPTVLCRRTRWAATAALRLRYATVDLSDAVLEYPVIVATHSRPFTLPFTDPPGSEEPELDRQNPRVQVVSLRGADAAHLLLADIDLTQCLFAGTVHLDQLRLEGLYHLPATPSGLRRRGVWPVRWTPRRTLAEEQHWRTARSTGTDGWTTPAPEGVDVLDPAALAPVYRQLRKAFEDGKHEPGAADFYYGEMEMRRHADDIPLGERSVLAAYWAVSGYGLRASRALGWLLLAMTTTVLLMTLWGLPKDDQKPETTGKLTDQRISLTTDTPEAATPDGPLTQRMTPDRFEKSLRVVINSVVFRSSGQGLTTFGTYTEMASRVTEPVLLGLAALAIRGRVKR